METIILNLIKLQNQLRILHWQTESFARHEAFGKAYNDLGDLMDELVEVHQGKYGRIKYPEGASVELYNKDGIEIEEVLKEVVDYLSSTFNTKMQEKDTDCLNIRDEMLAVLNKLSYLLTLK
jgi:DNA-binding ferritin-like protein